MEDSYQNGFYIIRGQLKLQNDNESIYLGLSLSISLCRRY